MGIVAHTGEGANGEWRIRKVTSKYDLKYMDFEAILCFNDSISVGNLHDFVAIGAALVIISAVLRPQATTES